MNQELRHGRFTSSKIGALQTTARDKVSFGAPALTYIEEKGMERRLERSLDTEVNARPLQWGKAVEGIAFAKLGTQYEIISDETIVHPSHPYWSGSPDLRKHGTDKIICDIKCPVTLKSFCQLVDAYKKGGIQQVRADHKDGDTYYWQLVSNAILTGCNKAELIVYMPYLTELAEIRKEASIWGYRWIENAADIELPYIKENGYYQSINVLAFDIPQTDIDSLTENVIKANAILTETPITIHDTNITIYDKI